MTTAQITIFLDSAGNYHCEAPGQNGARCKVEFDPDSLPAWQRAELIDQQHRIKKAAADAREQEQKRAKQRHADIVDYTAEHYPSILACVEPSVRKISKILRAKYREIGYTEDDINKMEKRGEFPGAAFFGTVAKTTLEDDRARKVPSKKPLTPSENLALHHALRQVQF